MDAERGWPTCKGRSQRARCLWADVSYLLHGLDEI